MASSRKSSLVSRAGAAARKVVGRAVGADQGDDAEVPQETPAKKAPAAKRAPAKKTAPTAKKAPAKKTAPTAEKAPAKKATAKKAPATKAPAKKSAGAAKKSPPAGKSKPGTSPAPKSTTPTTRPVKTSPATAKATQKANTSTPVSTQDIAQQAPAKKTAATTPAKKARTPQTAAQLAPQLVVLEHEDPWTTQELEEVRAQLTSDVARLTGELREVEGDLAGMIENPGDGSGHDQADIGSASFERDQERQIVNNARDMLEQSQHALERIDDGSYGQCEIGGEPIGKNRLMAFPRATLCLTCKQREERR